MEARRAINTKYRLSEKGIAMRRRSAQRTRDEKQAKIKEIKEASPCLDCERFYPAICMDFDHVRGEKTATIAKLMVSRYSWDRIAEEITKCEVVCSNCHRIRTEQRRISAELLTEDDIGV